VKVPKASLPNPAPRLTALPVVCVGAAQKLDPVEHGRRYPRHSQIDDEGIMGVEPSPKRVPKLIGAACDDTSGAHGASNRGYL